jgi:benzoate membrane transport protein
MIGGWRGLIPPLSVAITITIFSIAALALPLAAAQELGLSSEETGRWILACYGVPAILGLALTWRYQQPIFFTWHTSLVIFLASVAGQFGVAQIRGGILVAGVAIAFLGASGLSARVARLVPAPVVFAVVAGTVLPFVARTFSSLETERLIVGVVIVTWVASRRLLGAAFPPTLPALVAGFLVAAFAGEVHAIPGGWTLPGIDLDRPQFSLAATLTIAPVFVALISLQGNLTATTYMRTHGYQPPAKAIDVVSGIGTMFASFLGPSPVNLGWLVTPLTVGPEAGPRQVRPWSVYFGATGFLLIGLAGGVAAGIPQAIPIELLLAVAGLALVGVLLDGLTEMTRGPIVIGPVLTLAVTVSGLTMFDLGAPFWGLVIGTAVSLLVERNEQPAIQQGVARG